MKRKDYQVALTATIGVVMVLFLCTIFIANANLSFAASDEEEAPAVALTSAVDNTEERIKQLHGALMITEAQEKLWNNLTGVMRENAKDMDARTKERVGKTKPMNAVEHLKFYEQISIISLDQQSKIIPPFEALYDSMSDRQKQIADIIFMTGRHGKYKF